MRAVHHEKRANRVVAAPAQPGLGQEQWRGGSLRDEDETLESWGGLRCQLAEWARGELCDLETNISNPKTPSTNPRRRRGVRQTAHKLLVGTVSGKDFSDHVRVSDHGYYEASEQTFKDLNQRR